MNWQTDNSLEYRNSIATVDIGLISVNNKRILLGRKADEDKFRFPGGFVDPVLDTCFEDTAIRELSEECPKILADLDRYVCSIRANDPRYSNDRCKLFTSLFLFHYRSGSLEAGDDLVELKWFPLDLFENGSYTKIDNTIMPVHKSLMIRLLIDMNDHGELAR